MRKRKSNKTKGVLEQERLLAQTLKKVGYKGGRKGLQNLEQSSFVEFYMR